jgi:hypothetical protein
VLPLARHLAGSAVSLLIGWLIVGRLLGTGERSAAGVALRASLAWLVGQGVTSILLFLWMFAAGAASPRFVLFEVALAALGIALARARPIVSTAIEPPAAVEGPTEGGRQRLVITCAGIMVLTMLARIAFVSAREPHGGWDAWAIWNLRARFLYRAGAEWRSAFSPHLDWSHPDYPLLLPLGVVRGWLYAGGESPLVPVTIAALATLATAGILFGALRTTRSAPTAALATTVLLAPPAFIAAGSAQYADVLVGAYVLGAFAVLHRYDRGAMASARLLVLAGALAAMAAWTKNEGWLFLAAFLAARVIAVSRRKGLRATFEEMLRLGAGAAPVLLVVAAFKLGLAPANDLVAGQGGDTVARLAEGWRYGTIVAAAARQLVHPLLWAGAPVLLAAYALLVGRGRLPAGERTTLRTAVLGLSMVAVGFFLVYLVTPRDLPWQLATSLSRLIAQLWPASVFALFLLLRDPADARPPRGAARSDAHIGLSRSTAR